MHESRGDCVSLPQVRKLLLVTNMITVVLTTPVLVLSLILLLHHDDQVREGYLIRKNYATYASILLAALSIIMLMTGLIGEFAIWKSNTKGSSMISKNDPESCLSGHDLENASIRNYAVLIRP